MTFHRPRRAPEVKTITGALGSTETYTVTEVSRAFGLTPRALRYYEELRLIEARRDRRNRRVYDPAACARLEMILPLRRAGVPLEMISRTLSSPASDPGGVVADMLERQLQALNAQIAVVRNLLRDAKHTARRSHLREV